MTTPAALTIDPALATELLGGTWHGPKAAVTVRGATIDSRDVRAGGLFACLVGTRVDGHDYADVAVGAGAELVLAERPVAVPAPVIVVADVTIALGRLAHFLRQQLSDTTWIGVTGSNGKTTVKALLQAACAPAGAVHVTAGNRNNQLGVPLTVLATPTQTRIAVIEMGTSEPGEIGLLADMVQPDIGVITGIGPAHLEGLGGLAGVAHEKSALFAALADGAPALFSRHGMATAALAAGIDASELDAIVAANAAHTDLSVFDSDAIAGEVVADGVCLDFAGERVCLPLIGPHNLANAHLAWQAAIAAGVAPLAALEALASVAPVSGRLSEQRIGDHALIDDSYNANPASMLAGLAVLARRPGARIAVLGAMGELGDDSAALHAQVGAEAARLGLALVTVGEAARAIAQGYTAQGGRDLEHTDDVTAAARHLGERMVVGPTTVLVKASRSAGLERVVADLQTRVAITGESGIHAVPGDAHDVAEGAAC